MTTKEQKREMIINAALKVFSQKGVNSSTIEDISRQAEIGKGTVYEYFESKKSLFQEMIKVCVHRYAEVVKRSLSEEGTLRVKLKNFLRQHIKFLNENIDIFFSAAGVDFISEDIKQWIMNEKRIIFSHIEDTMNEAVKNGEIRESVDIELAAFCLLGTANMYGGSRVLDNISDINDSELDSIVDIIVEGIGN
ncbi:MAG: TetR/AcrR family transcriptional regulator [Acetivibrionales bacterium]|jgi:AcrR family transcriptional regulator